MDDQTTVEVDFKGLHVAILYAEHGQGLSGDPYKAPDGVLPELDRKIVRKLIKRLVLIGLNAKDKSAAYKSFRSEGTKFIEKHIENSELDELLDVFLARNPLMRGHMFNDEGIRLMNIDSKITARILNHFTQQGVPVLGIHDSYIIDCRKLGELRQAMADASEAVVGRPLATAVSFPGIEEYTDLTDYEIAVRIENKLEQHRRDPYVQRALDFEERTGRIISPYDRGLEGYRLGDYPEDLEGDSEWDT